MTNDVRCKANLDGMGCVGDLGWYCIGFTLFAFNYDLPTSVTGHPGTHAGTMPAAHSMYPGTIWNEERVPMSAGAVLLWDDGRKASFHCSFDRVLMQSMEVAGTQGVVYVDDWVIPYKVRVWDVDAGVAHECQEHEVRFNTTTKVTLRDHATRITSEGQSIVVCGFGSFSACDTPATGHAQPAAGDLHVGGVCGVRAADTRRRGADRQMDDGVACHPSSGVRSDGLAAAGWQDRVGVAVLRD